MRLSMMKWSVGLVLASLVAGCASSEAVPVKGPRPPLQASTVKLYQTAPKKYEKHGMIEVPITGDIRMDERGDATAGFERLKALAAARGANGVLLVADPGKFTLKVTAGYMGTFYQVPIRENPRTAVAEAIFMLEEKK